MKCTLKTFFLILLGIIIVSCYFQYSHKPTTPIVADRELLKDVTILTSSYDGYSELWEAHYKLLFKNWPSLKQDNNFIPIILITNELEYNDPRVISLKVGKDTTWSNNLLKALESVKTKYVFLLLDDYITSTPVDEDRFVELLTLLEKTNGAYIEIVKDDGAFSIGGEKDRKLVPGINGVIYRSKNARYRNSLQACIWNLEELRKLIDPKESAWDFEIIGSKRTEKNPKPFFLVTDRPVISYLNAVGQKVYVKEVIDYINSQGIEFNPTKLPIKTREEMKEYLNSPEAYKVLSPNKALNN